MDFRACLWTAAALPLGLLAGGCGHPSDTDAVAPATGGAGPDGAGFIVDVTRSSVIATVGIVTWSLDQPIESAEVHFGRDPAALEYTAPVDLAEEHYRTVLVGMKQETAYTLRIEAHGSNGQTYVSDDVSFETGLLPNGLPPRTVNDVDREKVYDGFTITCNGYGNARNLDPNAETCWALILDRDGDYVWAYDLLDSPVYGCSRARMSADGRSMWAGNGSTMRATGALLQISMDGLTVRDYSLPARHHDFTVLPSGHILYFEQQNGGGFFDDTEGPDSVMELDPETGQSSLVYDETQDLADIIASVGGSHTNSITYAPRLDAFSFSLLYADMIALVSYPDARLLGIFGGPSDQFGVSWNSQHGHQFVGDDTLLVFNNWSDQGASAMLEFTYDLEQKTATPIHSYHPAEGFGTIAFGGVQRLPNGNSVVTFSSNGVIHEIDPDRNLVRETVIGDPIGYSTKRATLYGPPPHLAAD